MGGKRGSGQIRNLVLIRLYLCETPIAPDEKPEAVEVGVEADLSGHGLPLLVGVIDLVRAGGRIVDFKTSARKPNAELLAHTAETQTASCTGKPQAQRKTGSRFIT